MNYKTFIQIVLLFIILFLLTFIYFEYFKTKKPLNQITKQTEKIINEKQLSVNDEDQNTLHSQIDNVPETVTSQILFLNSKQFSKSRRSYFKLAKKLEVRKNPF